MLVKKNLIQNFIQNLQGVTGVELALTFPIYAMLIFGTIELGWVNFQKSMLDTAVQDVSRIIYVESERNNGITRAEIETAICARTNVIPDCEHRILAELVVSNTFDGLSINSVRCRPRQNWFFSRVRFTMGAPNQIGFLRVCVRSKLMTPYGAKILGMTENDGEVILLSANAFLFR